MSDDRVWNDETRQKLRERLRDAVLGELRLSRSPHDEIIDSCRVGYIQDDCPEGEHKEFIQFASEELRRAIIQLKLERAAWPEVTDCDRLDRAGLALQKSGILLWQASPCCDTCTLGELSDRIEVIESRSPGFRERVRGYTFFIDQNIPDRLAEDTALTVYLAYGWVSPDYVKATPDAYEGYALDIAREVCECLREHQFEPVWDGSMKNKIGLSLNWQRRTLLV